MKWQGRRKSDNLEDRQGCHQVVNHRGWWTNRNCYFTSECFGGENGQMVGNILEQTQGKQSAPTEQRDLTEQELENFINAILVDEDVWTKIFQENNMTYEEPNMVLLAEQ
jgi:predicted metalloprotease